MRLLIDSNIVLELVLEQAKAEEVRALLVRSDEHEFFISDYSLDSIGILLFTRKQQYADPMEYRAMPFIGQKLAPAFLLYEAQ